LRTAITLSFAFIRSTSFRVVKLDGYDFCNFDVGERSVTTDAAYERRRMRNRQAVYGVNAAFA